jgi:hypothetical protein
VLNLHALLEMFADSQLVNHRSTSGSEVRYTGETASADRQNEFESVEECPVFTHTPLDGPRHVRLIHVEASDNFNAPLRISLVTATLDKPCFYQTLSYTWGETFADGSHLSEVIFCQSRQLRITPNLYAFLGRFRSRIDDFDLSSSIPLWIDGICIN